MKKRLLKSNNKMVSGVLAGVAEYLGIDPTVTRIVFILILLATGVMPGLLVYIVLMIMMPEQPGR